MNKRKRYWQQGIYYHVISRGIRKYVLFKHQSDFEFFINLLERTNEKYPFKICSYCLMSTHYHLKIIADPTDNLSKIMEHNNKLYARYYNFKYKSRGPVFDRNYVSKPITDRRSMLLVSRYIHYNPITAGIINKVEDYPWSSCFYYHPNTPIKDIRMPSYLNQDPILSQFNGTAYQQKKKYLEWSAY